MRIPKRPAVFIGTLAASGCSLLTDLGGFSTPEPPPNADIGEGRGDAGPALPDVSPPSDGSTIDGPLLVTDAGRFCQPDAHLFCDDFDDGVPSPSWTGTEIEPSASVLVSFVRALSPPRSLAVTTKRRGATDPFGYATIKKRFDGWQNLVVEFDLYVERPAWQAGDVNAGFAVVSYFSSAASDDIAMVIGDGYVTIATPKQLANRPAFPDNRWVHVRLDVTPKSLTTWIDGDLFSQTWTELTKGNNAVTEIDVGISGFNRPAPPFQAFYDNVTIDAK